VSYPLHSSGPAPTDFFLFGYLKEKLRGTSFITSDDRIFAIRQIFSEIPELVLKSVQKLDHEIALGDEEG
jgi:hypothetical protein